ncbi:MAG: NAD(P)/FAD-dependent oxidoreductase [Proteobacteria bacterium]|nr:NAD(P)/FAD-dependent oxidoreductase [Pseudomonadota bacterium]
MDAVDVVVVGAGAVGLAVARALALAGREVLILEAADRFGTGASSRNSEVIHAGIYYPQGSLKARMCVAGRDQLYVFCREHGVAHRQCGKLLVAVNDTQLPGLRRLQEAARANGVVLQPLTREQALALEPQLQCSAGLFSPLTGIVDSNAYMLALLGEVEAHGATLVCHSRVSAVQLSGGRALLSVNGASPALSARLLINCAGLEAPALAGCMQGLAAEFVPRAWFARGSYFLLKGRAPFTHLVYPMPEPGGLGIHLTLDMSGRARFGPDVQWIEAPDYHVDSARATHFAAAVRRYWPGLPDDALEAGYAGVRPKISGPGMAAADFRIDDVRVHGLPQLINLFGIESPGLTSSLALADEVVRRL